ncbi:MAG: Xylose isomerase domain protein barrel [Chloroflexi bacterium]|nr:Xylose isomerase domain protein barrel [Chloroflexota bacterium]
MFRSLNARALGISAPLDDALTMARSNNFAGLDLVMPELLEIAAQSSVLEIKDRFAAAEIRPGAWSLPVSFRSDEATYQADLAELPRAAALAQALGTPWCSTVIMPFSDERDYAANLAFHVARLRPAAQILSDYGCRLGLEFIGPRTLRAGHTYPFISTIEGALDLGAALGTGNVGLLLDAFHWYTSHASLGDIQRLVAHDIVYVHMNDAVPGRGADQQLDQERDLPGATGVIDIVSFLQAVAGTNFDGPVAVEPFNAAVLALEPTARARVAGESLARVWAQADCP